VVDSRRSEITARRSRPGPQRARAFVGITLMTILFDGGCSLFFAEPPPAIGHPLSEFVCTDSPALPLIDVGLSLLSIAGTIRARSVAWPMGHKTLTDGSSGEPPREKSAHGNPAVDVISSPDAEGAGMAGARRRSSTAKESRRSP
jgi:hypothetical protein